MNRESQAELREDGPLGNGKINPRVLVTAFTGRVKELRGKGKARQDPWN